MFLFLTFGTLTCHFLGGGLSLCALLVMSGVSPNAQPMLQGKHSICAVVTGRIVEIGRFGCGRGHLSSVIGPLPVMAILVCDKKSLEHQSSG